MFLYKTTYVFSRKQYAAKVIDFLRKKVDVRIFTQLPSEHFWDSQRSWSILLVSQNLNFESD